MNTGIKHFAISIFLSFTPNVIFADAIEIWNQMQKDYTNLCNVLDKNGYVKQEKLLSHSCWRDNKSKIKNFILGPICQDFVTNSIIGGAMVRRGFDIPQVYEVCFLKHCISAFTLNLLKKYNDTDFVGLPRECKDFNCSTSTLGHLFYAAKVLEKNGDKKIETIIEFGGGYGNLARIFKTILPASTIVIIDLPELLALQYFFLKSTMPGIKIILHSAPSHEYEQNAIHLIPVALIKDCSIKSDLFISTFALSEASEEAQRLIVNKNFFNARMAYITGQLEGWGSQFNFVSQDIIHSSIRKHYLKIDCQPFHFLLNGLQSYEIIGMR